MILYVICQYIQCNIIYSYVYSFIKVCYNYIIMESIDLFLLNVETLVKEKNITKQAFCDELGFSRSSFVNWKNQSSIPNGDTVIKIADYFKVDPKWLLTGTIDLPEDNESKPSAIFERVYHLLLETTNTPDPDYHPVSDTQMKKMWKSVEKIISCYDLFNWQCNRIMPSYKQILELAEHFEKPFTYIANGIPEVPEYLNPCKVPESDYKDFKRFTTHKEFMYLFHNLSEDSMKIVEELVRYLFKKEHEE